MNNILLFVDGLWPDYNDGTWPACCNGPRFDAKEVIFQREKNPTSILFGISFENFILVSLFVTHRKNLLLAICNSCIILLCNVSLLDFPLARCHGQVLAIFELWISINMPRWKRHILGSWGQLILLFIHLCNFLFF